MKIIVNLEKLIKKIEPEFIKNSKLFHSKKEAQDLYQNIIKFTAINGLTIIGYEENERKAVINKEATQTSVNIQDNQNQDNQISSDPNSAKPLYYKIPVSYKIQGNFGSSSSKGYLIFRKALSKLNKVINFDAETITIEKETGLILSEVTLSTVGLPDEYN